MKPGRILVLFAVVAALGAYLWFWEVPKAKEEATKEKLVTVDKDAVTGVSLVFPDRQIELAKTDKGWRLTKPLDAPADDPTVKTVVAAIADAEVQKAIDQLPAELGQFGLDKPEPLVTLTTAKGPLPAIAVGKATAIGGKAYVRRGDEPKVLLTASSLRFALNKQVKDLRDKSILSFADDAVTKIVTTAPNGPTVTLTKKDKDAWTVDPGDLPADVNEVRSYLSTLRSTRAMDFPDDAPTNLAPYGLDTPRLTVTVTLSDGSSQALLLGNDLTAGQQKQVYAKRADVPTVVAVGDYVVRSLTKDPKTLRDKTVLGFDTSRVGKLTLARKDGTTVEFERGTDKAWQVSGPDAAKSKTTTIERFLDDVHDLRGSDVAAEPPGDLKPFGLDAPDVRVTLTDKDGQPMGVVLAAKANGKYYAMREGGPTVFEVRDYMVTRLDKPRAEFVVAEPPAGGATTTTAAAPDLGGDDGEPPDDGGGDADGD